MIQLFSNIIQVVGRKRLDGAGKKGGFKVYGMIDAFTGSVEFASINEGREHDQRLIYQLNLVSNS